MYTCRTLCIRLTEQNKNVLCYKIIYTWISIINVILKGITKTETFNSQKYWDKITSENFKALDSLE